MAPPEETTLGEKRPQGADCGPEKGDSRWVDHRPDLCSSWSRVQRSLSLLLFLPEDSSECRGGRRLSRRSLRRLRQPTSADCCPLRRIMAKQRLGGPGPKMSPAWVRAWPGEPSPSLRGLPGTPGDGGSSVCSRGARSSRPRQASLTHGGPSRPQRRKGPLLAGSFPDSSTRRSPGPRAESGFATSIAGIGEAKWRR